MFKRIKSFFGRIYRFIIYEIFAKHISFLKPIYYSRSNLNPITFKTWIMQKIFGFNRHAYWPVHFTTVVVGYKNIYVGKSVSLGASNGCYIQAVGKVFVGDYTQVAPNVGIISSNHFMLDIREHVKSEVRIGEYCRIGMGSVILPGVQLGDFTTVSAGSIVNTSFPNGYCVISGNPARIVADYSKSDSIKEKFIRFKNPYEFNGYIPAEKFDAYRKKHLNV